MNLQTGSIENEFGSELLMLNKTKNYTYTMRWGNILMPIIVFMYLLTFILLIFQYLFMNLWVKFIIIAIMLYNIRTRNTSFTTTECKLRLVMNRYQVKSSQIQSELVLRIQEIQNFVLIRKSQWISKVGIILHSRRVLCIKHNIRDYNKLSK